MWKIHASFLFVILCTALVASGSQASPRERLLMDFGWQFTSGDPAEVGATLDYPEVRDLAKVRKADLKDQAKVIASQVDAAAAHLGEKLQYVQPTFDDSAWRHVDLPHDWVVELPFSPQGDYQHGFKDIDPSKGTNIGWYRRTFDLPVADKDKSLWLEFDGVYRNSLVWLNGHCLGRHPSGYTSFMYDISKYANFGGRNVLVVRVDATRYEGWFYEGGGIYRHVWLVKTDPLHVAQWGTFVTTSEPTSDGAIVLIETTIRNDADHAENCSLNTKILDSHGTPLAASVTTNGKNGSEANSAVEVPAHGEKTVTQSIIVPQPQLWSPESPSLYRAVSTISVATRPVENRLADTYETPFGIRTVKFTADAMLLNGKPVAIKGTCNHQDHAGVGVALPDQLQGFRIEKLKEMGSNAYRTSHNPPTPELLDACDRLGMLVLDETRRMGSDPEALGQLESMIRRDRNHPCVFAWSIGNEEFRDNIQGDNELGAPICQAMQDLAHHLDSSRRCTNAMNGSWGEGFSKVLDVQGFNYVTRGANGKRPGQSVDKFRADFPKQPCLGTEDGSTRCTRGIYADDKQLGYMNAYGTVGTSTPEHWWNFDLERPYLNGSFVWTGFDYRGEPTPYKWPCINSHFGILDTCGFPKDDFYYYQSQWTDKPVLHILPHWTWPDKPAGEEIDVWVHSNCDEVELLLNGESLGRKKMEPHSHLEWKVKYAPGTLSAKGYRGGQEIASDKVETTGQPAKLILHADRQDINADGEDVAVVDVAIQDVQDRTVPTAGNLVKFEVQGDAKIIGVGNGDPSCHEPDKATQRSAFNGLCMAIVQASKHPGDVVITAASEGLQPATITLHAKSVTIRPAVAEAAR